MLILLPLIAAAPGPHMVVRTSAALEFTYEWPAEAAAIPALDLRFYKQAKHALTEAQNSAREDQKLAKEQKRDFNGHYYSMAWSTAGKTLRLLSLQSEFGTFEGGAHPNRSYGALLWDQALGREIALSDQFIRPASFAALTRPAYCKGLDKERSKRREGERLDLPEFNACPRYSELAIAPVDRDQDGRFDTIRFVASPYVAGPYVEGEYENELPVSTRIIAGMKPAYRHSYEPQRQ
ncbi:MAG TPA: DUF4163 domain-containing protein [Sphingomicrobium sp.]|nr:DUF4163 domain-containing protein [Sphingomicrobium sp.]